MFINVAKRGLLEVKKHCLKPPYRAPAPDVTYGQVTKCLKPAKPNIKKLFVGHSVTSYSIFPIRCHVSDP